MRHRPRIYATRPENRPVIRLFQALDVCYARIYHRLTVHSPVQLPRQGPAILVCNHTSGLDPLLIQAVCPRLIIWMIAKEYYDLPALNRLFRVIQAIPVERSGRDAGALREAMRTLADGMVLGIFPEGRIETERKLLPFQTGVALMGLKTQVPIFPAFLDGTQRGQSMRNAFLYQQVAQLAFGSPIRLNEQFSAKDLTGATQALESAVHRLGMEVCALLPAVDPQDPKNVNFVH